MSYGLWYLLVHVGAAAGIFLGAMILMRYLIRVLAMGDHPRAAGAGPARTVAPPRAA
jgi:hypothetical protein